MTARQSPLSLTRRAFLGQAVLATGAAGIPFSVRASATTPKSPRPFIQTVLGPIPADQFGLVLTHEHVMCDFIGADQTDRRRWNVDEVVQRMLPYLKQLKARGVRGFVDCTPAYIGRDPRVLKRLAQDTGLHLVTNTGYYGAAGDKFVPKHAYQETASQLADRWVREWERGLEDTSVRPGFIKTGVDEAKGDPPQLSEIDAKLVRAAALTSKRTGLPVVCHTSGGPAGLAATELFVRENTSATRLIIAHSDGHGLEINQRIAARGAWVSFDAIGHQPTEQHVKLVTAMLEKHSDRLLLSHDNGWYSVGQPNGGEVRDFNFLTDSFLPALRQAGVSDATRNKLTVNNPATAFGLVQS